MRDNTAISDGLRRLLDEEVLDRRAQILSCEALTGGYSRVMTRVQLRWDNGTEETLILRADPDEDEAVYQTDRRAEWLILRALTESGSVPTPPARFYDEGRHLGTRTIVLDFCEGPSLHKVLSDGGADLETRSDEVATTLAAIHRTPLDSVRPALGQPPTWDQYTQGLIEQWELAERLHLESVPVLRYLAAWLSAHRPTQVDYTLVHGDFQAANMLDAATGLQVIDWEFAHIGDPREDLGWFNIYSASSGAPNLYARDPDRFLGRYRELTGASVEAVNEATVAYFSVLAATRVYLDILRSAAAMAEGRAHGVMITYSLNAVAVGNFNWLSTCLALSGSL
jgi:aminoglycoside phosphotransferase (APT) family kinase protein